MDCAFSLAPGFSPVLTHEACENRFNGFLPTNKPLKRLVAASAMTPG